LSSSSARPVMNGADGTSSRTCTLGRTLLRSSHRVSDARRFRPPDPIGSSPFLDVHRTSWRGHHRRHCVDPASSAAHHRLATRDTTAFRRASGHASVGPAGARSCSRWTITITHVDD
jgi:hypothetical protein